MEKSQQSTTASEPPLRSGPPRARKVSPGSGHNDGLGARAAVNEAPQSASTAPQAAGLVEPARVTPKLPQESAPAVPTRSVTEPVAQRTQEPKRRLRFEEKYDRITLYLAKQINTTLRERYDSGEIDNLSAFFNAAVKDYIAKHFGV